MPESGNHIGEDELERYCVGKSVVGEALNSIEEHLLTCDLCRARLEQMSSYVETMKRALRLIKARERHNQS